MGVLGGGISWVNLCRGLLRKDLFCGCITGNAGGFGSRAYLMGVCANKQGVDTYGRRLTAGAQQHVLLVFLHAIKRSRCSTG